MAEFLTDDQLVNLPVLFTDRLILRPMAVADATRVVQWRNGNHVAEFSKSKDEITILSHLDWFRATRSDRIDYIVLIKENLQPIGSFSYKRHEALDGNRSAEMGKYIGEHAALGKGYAKDGIGAWIEFGFNFCQFDIIVALTRSDNAPNIRINKSMGFLVERDYIEFDIQWVFMVLNRSTWLKRGNFLEL